MGITISRSRVTDYIVKWNSTDLGAVDKVTPDLKIKTKPIKFGTTGDVVLGERVIALEGTIKVEVREVDLAQMQLLMPQYTSANAAIPIIPGTIHKDLYDYAQILILHPTHLAANVLTEDLTLLKAVPKVYDEGERDGVGEDKVIVEFSFYPDRAQLAATPPVLCYGYLGAPP